MEGRSVPDGHCVRGEPVGESVGEHHADTGNGSRFVEGSVEVGICKDGAERDAGLGRVRLCGEILGECVGAGTRKMVCSLNVCASTRWT